MKKTVLFVLLIFTSALTRASTYYFSSSQGNDSRSSLEAQKAATPWKTLTKLAAFFSQIKPGDSILLKRGDVFDGSFAILSSGTTSRPIVVSAYGSGAKPVINGLNTLSGWTSLGNNVWQAACSSCDPNINLLLLNGQPKEVGRYPNRNDPNNGYLTLESHSGTSSISDKQLASTPNWTGGEVVIRKNRWIIDKSPILKHTGNTITYSDPGDYEPKDNFGYFIQRHPLTLDQAGEWYFDKVKKVIKIHFGGGNPQQFNVKASVVNVLVSINSQNNLVFDDLAFTGANLNAFAIVDAENITIRNCSIQFSGTNALTAAGTKQLRIQNNYIETAYNNALVAGPDCTNSQIVSNTIKNTALSPGMGKSGDETYQAIIVKGSDNIVTFNRIDSTGYVPIRFEGNNTEIRNNHISNFASVKDDGGGIYTHKDYSSTSASSNRKITGNIIIGGKGAGEGTDNPAYLPVFGIYMDDYSDNVEIKGNTVAFCNSGVYLHNTPHITVRENTLFSNNSQLLMVHDNKAASSPIRNFNAVGNILFAKQPTQLFTTIESIKEDIQSFGRFDSNYYSRPTSDNFAIQASLNNNGDYISRTHNLGSWQQTFGMDKKSVEASIKIPAYTISSLNAKNQYENGRFNSNISGVSYHSPSDNCKTTWSSGGKLDAGALSITFNNKQEGNTSQVIVRMGGINTGKNYILRFSLLGSVLNRKVKVYLRNSFAPYNRISNEQSAAITNTRSENEMLFLSSAAVSSGCIVFEMEDANSALWLDNIELYEATVMPVNPDNYIRFEYNATDKPKSILLDSTYTDVKGTLYSGSISLPAYGSVILIKKSKATTAGAKQEVQQSNAAYNQIPVENNRAEGSLQVTPNPVRDVLQLAFQNWKTGEKVRYVIQNISGAIVKSNTLEYSSLLKIDVYSLSTGFYVLKVIVGSLTSSTTFIKE